MKLPDLAATYRLKPIVLRLRADRRKYERSDPERAAGVEMLARETLRIGRQGAVAPCRFADAVEAGLLEHLLGYVKGLHQQMPLKAYEREAFEALARLVEAWPPWFTVISRRLVPVPAEVTLPGSLFPWESR
jgi:hypothetical protein